VVLVRRCDETRGFGRCGLCSARREDCSAHCREHTLRALELDVSINLRLRLMSLSGYRSSRTRSARGHLDVNVDVIFNRRKGMLS
jgi:hypothetical protein